MKAVFDTNILIDYLQGKDSARIELARYSSKEISIVTWMEILAGADSPEDEAQCREFLGQFKVHQLSVEIAEESVLLRKKYRIRLPDAIIWATARVNNQLIVTGNSKDFNPSEPGVRIPYKLK